MTEQQAYALARDQYAAFGVDADAALLRMDEIPVSIHCWSLDDLSGFESPDKGLGGGLAATGRAPAQPRSPDEYFRHAPKA